MATPDEASSPSFCIRPLNGQDEAAFADFTAEVLDGERRFLKEDFAKATASFANYERDRVARRLVAADEDGRVLGLAGVFPGVGWSSHVAELRVLVLASHRRRGVGRALARAALVEALRIGCSQAYVEVVAQQESLVIMFQDMGFEPAALLPDFVRDAAGDFHDLMILTHRSDEQAGLSHLLSLDEVVA